MHGESLANKDFFKAVEFITLLGIDMAARLRRYFITGLLSTLPIAVTLYFLWWVYNWSNSLIEGILRTIGAEPSRWLLPFLPILGILATLGLVTLVGALAGNYVGRLILGAIDRSIKTIPLVREVYNAVQQIAHTLLGQPEVQFQRAALIEYPAKVCIPYVLLPALRLASASRRCQRAIQWYWCPPARFQPLEWLSSCPLQTSFPWTLASKTPSST